MNTTTPNDLQGHLLKEIDEWIKESITVRWEEAKKKMIEQMDRDRDRDIAACVLSVAKHMTMNDLGTHLVIHIDKTP